MLPSVTWSPVDNLLETSVLQGNMCIPLPAGEQLLEVAGSC